MNKNEYYKASDGFFDFYVNVKTGEKKFVLEKGDVLVERNSDDFNRDKEVWLDNQKIVLDPTGARLTPGAPTRCQGNGKHPRYEICCDECDYYLECFPEER